MAGEVSFGPLWHALATPCNESVLWQASVGVLDFQESKLNSAIGEFVY